MNRLATLLEPETIEPQTNRLDGLIEQPIQWPAGSGKARIDLEEVHQFAGKTFDTSVRYSLPPEDVAGIYEPLTAMTNAVVDPTDIANFIIPQLEKEGYKPSYIGAPTGKEKKTFLESMLGFTYPAKPPNWENASPIEKFNFATLPISDFLGRVGGKIAGDWRLTTKEDVQKILAFEYHDTLKWYQKSPEVAGWAGEQIAKYAVLKMFFAVSGLSNVLTSAGQKISQPFISKTLSAEGMELKTLSGAGIRNLLRQGLVNFLQAAPENTAFVGSWSGLDSALKGNPPKQIAFDTAKGMGWGVGLTAGMGFLAPLTKIPEVQGAFQRAAAYLARKYPKTIDFLSKDIEPEIVDQTVKMYGESIGQDIRFTELPANVQAGVRNAARALKKELIKAAQKEEALKTYWSNNLPKETTAITTGEAPTIAEKPSVEAAGAKITAEPTVTGPKTVDKYFDYTYADRLAEIKEPTPSQSLGLYGQHVENTINVISSEIRKRPDVARTYWERGSGSSYYLTVENKSEDIGTFTIRLSDHAEKAGGVNISLDSEKSAKENLDMALWSVEQEWGKPEVLPKAEVPPTKVIYTSVPTEWQESKKLYDWGQKGLRAERNRAFPASVGSNKLRKTFIWSSEFDRVPVRLPRSTMDALRAKTDEIWKVQSRSGEDYYIVPKKVLADVKNQLPPEAFIQNEKLKPTPNQLLQYSIQSANIRGDVHPGSVIEIALADKSIGITETNLTANQKKILAEFRSPEYEQQRNAVLQDIKTGLDEKISVARKETDERLAIQQEQQAGEIGDFLDGLIEPKRPKDLLGREMLQGGAAGTQTEFLEKEKYRLAEPDIEGQKILIDLESYGIKVAKPKTIEKAKALGLTSPETDLTGVPEKLDIKPSEEIKSKTSQYNDSREAGFVAIPLINTTSAIEAENPNISIQEAKKDIGPLQKYILTLTNQAYNSKDPEIISAAEEMADTGMRMWNETQSSLTVDQHFYKQLPKEYRQEKGVKFFELMDKHYSPEEITAARDIPEEIKPILTHFKEQDEVMRQEIIGQKRAMWKALYKRQKKAELQNLAKESGLDIENKKKSQMAEDLAAIKIPDDWGREWSHIQHIFLGQYNLRFRDTEGNVHFIGRAETRKEAVQRLADFKDARKAEGFGDADDIQLIADREFSIPYDVLRVSRKQAFVLEQHLAEAVAAERQEISDAIRGIIGKRESKQKWWGALMHRKGAEGYLTDFWKVWAIQTSQFNRWKFLTQMNRTVTPLIEKIKAKGLPGWAERLENSRDILWSKKRTVTAKTLDGLLNEIPVVRNYHKPWVLERWTGMFKTINYWRHLQTGRFYVVNSLQPLQTLWPIVGEKGLYRGFRLYYSKEGQRILREHKVAGLSGKVHELGMKRARKFERFLPAGASEIRNQGVAFLALYDRGIKMGMNDSEAARYGRLRGQLFTQFTYTPSDIPGVMSSPIGGLAFQYKRFPIKNLELVSRLAREGNWGGVARWVAALLAVGGTSVFLKTIEVGGMGYLTYKLYKKIKDEWGEDAANVIHHGLPALVGIDLSGSVNPIDIPQGRNIYEKTGNLIFGPTGQTAIRLYGDLTEEKVAKEIGLIPRGLKSLVDSSPAAKQFVNLVDALQKDTTNYDSKQRATYKLETWDLWKKAFGFRPETESIQRMQFEATMDVKQLYDERLDEVTLARINNNYKKAADLIIEWNARWPEVPITISDTDRRMKERKKAREKTVTERGYEQLPKKVKNLFSKSSGQPPKEKL
jgi:hypothetical protein